MTNSIFQTSKLFTISIFILTILTLGSCSTSKQIGSVPNPTFKSYTEKSKHSFGKNQTKRDNRKQGKKAYVQIRNNEKQIKSSKDTNNLQSSQAELNQKKRIFTDIPVLEDLAANPIENSEPTDFAVLTNTTSKSVMAFTDIQNATKNDGTVKPRKNRLGKKLQKKFERQLYKFVPELDLERVDTNDKSKTQSGESKGVLGDKIDKVAIIASVVTLLTWAALCTIPFFGLTSIILTLLLGLLGGTLSIVSLKRIVSNPFLKGSNMALWSFILNIIPLILVVGLFFWLLYMKYELSKFAIGI